MSFIKKVNAGGNEYDIHAEALETAATIDGISFDGLQSVSRYGVCATAGATAAKTVMLGNDFVLSAGATVSVKFVNANTAANPTLNVNNTGAAAIMIYGSAPADGNTWKANGVVDLVYDGTYWQVKSGSLEAFAAEEVADLRNYVDNNFNIVLGAYPTETVSGAVVSVTDGADDLPVRSLKVGISPAQSGSGVPAPDNIRPISGRTGASVFHTGRNMFDEATAVLYDRFINMNATPKLWSYDAGSKSIAFPCKPNTAYTISCMDPDAENPITRFRVGYIETDIPSAIGVSPVVSGVVEINQAGSAALTTGEYATYIVVQLNAAILSARSSRLQIELGNATTPYEAYQGVAYAFDWESEAGTVYGGTLDVTTGILTVDRGLKVFTGQESNPGWEKFSNDNENGTYFGLAGTTEYAAFADDPEAICSINKRSSAANFGSGDGFYWTSGGWRILYGAAHAGESLDDFKTYVQQKYAAGTSVAVCAKLASPQTYQLTPAEVKTLLAENTLWADCGDVIELIVRADPTLFVNEKLAAAQRLTELMITAERTDTMTAPNNLTAGQLIVARGTLYKATENIASGAALVPNSNITETTVAAELAALA